MNVVRSARQAIARYRPEFREHCRELQEEGFTRIRGDFPNGLVTKVLDSVKHILRRNDEVFRPHIDADGHYPRIINFHLAHQPLLCLFTDSPLALAVQDEFFGAPSTLYTSLYYERGSAQSIHRDTPYFTTRPEYRYLGVWVALEDATESNGCLEVVRKGHLIPELDRPSIALQHYKTLDDVPPGAPAGRDILWDIYQSKVMESCVERGLRPERVEAKAGDVIIWHPQLPHGGSQIQDLTRTRHSFVMHVTPVGTPVYQQDVFFNPAKQVPDRAAWWYNEFAGRKFARFDSVDIGHRERRPATDFVQ